MSERNEDDYYLILTRKFNIINNKLYDGVVNDVIDCICDFKENNYLEYFKIKTAINKLNNNENINKV